MRAIALISFLPLAALAHPQGLWWGTDTCYNSPDNTDNECSDHQRTGFDWSDLADGAFSSYGGFDFSGFLSGNGFGGSASGDRCISGKLSRSSATSLVISAGADISAFSITNLKVSTSIETEIHIVYGMPDGSTCRDTAWCSPEAEDVSNDQCGGAISVGFELLENSDSEDCDLDIHLIDFDCSPGPKPPGGGHEHHPDPLPTPPSLPSPSVPGIPGFSTPVIPPPAITTPVIPPHGTTPPVGPVVTPPVPTSIPVQIPPPSSVGPSSGPSSPPEGHTTTVVTYETVTTCPVTNTITSGASVTTEVSSTVSTVTLTSTSTICTRCANPPTPGVPTGVLPTSAPAPPAQTTTVVTYETVTTCPVTTTITAGSTTSTSVYTTVSTVTLTSTNTIIPPTGAPSSPPNPPSSPHNPPSSPPLPPSECPTVVPKCINTWLDLPKCDSNADTTCFCPSSDFTNKVISCIQAWGSSAAEIQSALSYFTGICAAFVPTNPGIVTAVPTTITLGPVPKPTGAAPAPNGPPGAPGPGPGPAPCTTLTYSTYTVTVPQVGFSTSAGVSTTSVGLIPGPAPTGVIPGNTATRIPNPWTASSTLTTHRGVSSTAVAGPTETPPIFSNGGSKTVVVSGVWAVGVAVLVGFV
ncbi:extracellular serine-threonine rich protein [Aspergillus candidus]|uniref:CFEM domain-containing protein n=1 Tax=Aspergillus candidus TaxID=41067 RepID=A0A2I2FCV6_ASPCN|nr:hypothetical protein BDW47DRAFT_23015 [Aspergillus candidus]PLB38468.1 hypothetical protein BDW47DRAFT_23015 [Aspergillus candidus]